MSTITRTYLDENAKPVTVTLEETNISDAISATLQYAQQKYKNAEITGMLSDRVNIWGFNDPNFKNFGQGYYLHIED